MAAVVSVMCLLYTYPAVLFLSREMWWSSWT